ncbi:MAG: hypothetical protein V4696_13180 [Pseudomonadota bacterium]
MKNQIGFTAATACLLAISACQQPANDTDIAIDNGINAAEAANADIETLPPSDEGGAPVSLNNAAAPVANEAEAPSGAAVIPAQYRGRWGMNAADCDPKRSDNKGLITVAPTTIRFYESTATLKEQRPAIATSFSGTFGFTGEGQIWEKVVTLTRTGNVLKRADDEGSTSYNLCP